MIDPMCKPCEKDGVIRKAHRIVGSTPMCNDHFLRQGAHAPTKALEQLGAPQPQFSSGSGAADVDRAGMLRAPAPSKAMPAAPAKEKAMSERKVDIDWEQIRKEYAAGVSASALSEKYGVHVSTVYYRLKGAKSQKVAKTPKVNGKTSTPRTGLNYEAVLIELVAKRDRLNQVITGLQELQEL